MLKVTRRKVEAALKLQKVWRGFLGVRCRLKEDNAMREGEWSHRVSVSLANGTALLNDQMHCLV